MRTTTEKQLATRIDWPILFLYLTITLIGIFAIFSVEYRSDELNNFAFSKSFMKQGMWLGISLVVGTVILLLDSKIFTNVAFGSYLFGIFLLILVLFIHENVRGSKSFLPLGFARFQPGELSKIFTSLALAKFLSMQEFDFKKSIKTRNIAMGMVLLPCLLVIASSETGLALVYFALFLAMYRVGLPNAFLIIGFSVMLLVIMTLIFSKMMLLKILLVILGIFAIAMRKQLMRSRELLFITLGVFVISIGFSQFLVPFAFKHVLQPHQVDRIYTLIGQDVPDEYIRTNSSGENVKTGTSEYNVKQSKIAIGSGGFIGKGPLNGTQTQGHFVPEQSTDFIFCGIGEQFGFIGTFFLIALYVALLLRIVHIAERQRSKFTMIYAYCLAGILFFHLFINIGMTIGLAPVIGIPLPMMSYGGTSLLTFSILIFILLKLDLDRNIVIR